MSLPTGGVLPGWPIFRGLQKFADNKHNRFAPPLLHVTQFVLVFASFKLKASTMHRIGLDVSSSFDN